MWILPQELTTEILFHLPVKFLLRFHCVSKSSSALISDPDFIKTHFEINKERTILVQTCTSNNVGHLGLNQYSLLNFSDENQPVEVFPPFYHPEDLLYRSRIIGCCNGLVCFRTNDDNKIVIWNPSIRKYKKLPLEPTGSDLIPYYGFAILPHFAFGYDLVKDDYKLVKIMQYFKYVEGLHQFKRDQIKRDIYVYVYSLKAHSWRRLEDEWPCEDSSFGAGPVYLNSALHWLVTTMTGGIRLLAFHLTTEKFHQEDAQLPEFVESLDAWGGSLCVSTYGLEARGTDYWMMKEGIWSRLCTVPTSRILYLCGWQMTLRRWRVVVLSTDGEKVLMELDCGNNKKLFWFDIKNNTLSPALAHIPNLFRTRTCGESLLLLDGDSI
jgi:F-box interacting protein